jgi:hypothetical protein
MKKVLGSHAQTAHVWAQNIQTEGRASDKRMFFEGGTIYSYGRHFAIASHVKDLKGNAAVLFTTQGYSVSTAKHIGLVRRALIGNDKVYYVPEAQAGYEKENLARFDRVANSLVKKYAAPRIRQTTRDKIAFELRETLEKRNLFGFAFVKGYKAVAMPDDIRDLANNLEKAHVARIKAEARIKRREQEAKYKEAERDLGMPRHTWAAAWREHKDALSNSHWYTVKAFLREHVGTLLRLDGSSLNVVTSEGAEFPVKHAKLAFKMIRQTRLNKTTWQRNGHSIHLGAFQIDSIDTEGNVKAGCHTILWPEILLMAQKIGLVVHS